MNHSWKTIQENETYLGDMKDFYGKRIALIVHNGIAVFAQCPAEKHYVFKEDFEAIASTLDFVFAAKIENGLFNYSEELDSFFDQETIEDIHTYTLKTIS